MNSRNQSEVPLADWTLKCNAFLSQFLINRAVRFIKCQIWQFTLYLQTIPIWKSANDTAIHTVCSSRILWNLPFWTFLAVPKMWAHPQCYLLFSVPYIALFNNMKILFMLLNTSTHSKLIHPSTRICVSYVDHNVY